MAVERLGPGAAILATLRAELARRSGRGQQASAAPAQEADIPLDPRPDTTVLRRTLREVLASASEEERASPQLLRPRLVRAVLLWEFGPSLRNHPDWQEMMEAVINALEQDPAHQAQLTQLLRELQS